MTRKRKPQRKPRLPKEKEKAIVARRVAGMPVRDIAEAEGVAPTTVSKVMARNGPLIQRLTDEHQGALIEAYGEAIHRLRKDLCSNSAAARISAAGQLLRYITAADRLKAVQQANAGVSLAQVFQVYAEVVRG